MEMFALFGIIQIFIFLGVLVFGIYFLLTVLKLMREKNDYLKEISENINTYTNKS